MSNIMLDAPRVEIAVVRPAAHIPGCQLAPNHLSLDVDEHKFGIEPCSKLDQSICRMLDAICGTMVRAQASHKVTGCRVHAHRGLARQLARPAICVPAHVYGRPGRKIGSYCAPSPRPMR